MISSTGVVSFVKEHSTSFGTEKNLSISDIYLYMLNDDNPKAAKHRRFEGRLERPTGVSLTEYHMLLAYPNRLNALSIYTKTVVYEDIWPTVSPWGDYCDY
ncbi:hypothetical protein TELCIR_14433 [Teladorsagia circumcincta]|uniref:Pep3/Vps18 beta-propeller domain-containing protein n=1 Tax=Teladorsagia circumcincta TaxID=45464 RepID=A0A2G9U1B2_TELCI|nr:hypothetical protein TELCIR_14433 [Teladorsagia circumcincta]